MGPVANSHGAHRLTTLRQIMLKNSRHLMLNFTPRHFIFQMQYPRSSEPWCTYANSQRTTCLHGLRVPLTLNPRCWLAILFHSQSKWAFTGCSAIASGFASKQVFDGRSYRGDRPRAWGPLGWLSHPKKSVLQHLESSLDVPTGAKGSAPPP